MTSNIKIKTKTATTVHTLTTLTKYSIQNVNNRHNKTTRLDKDIYQIKIISIWF